MRCLRSVLFLLLFPFFAQFAFARQATTSVQRDPQATALLQASLSAMGGTVPKDSVATGSVTIVAGSQTSTGTIRVLTRGTDQTSEQITLPQSTATVTYSSGVADETINSATASLPLERSVTSQSVCFPLPFLAAALANPDISIQYVALETLNQQSVQHIRLQNSFASHPVFQQFADFAVFDVWLDAGTALPLRISFIRRDGGGSAPRIPVDAYFTSYKTFSGIIYPSQINVSLNGTPWGMIKIDDLSLNTGLSDADFATE